MTSVYILLVPIISGIGMVILSFLLFRRKRIPERYFGISLVVSGIVMVSPIVYSILSFVKSFFGIVYTFVLGFGLAIIVLFALIIYLILLIGELREEIKEVWQEVALAENETEQ